MITQEITHWETTSKAKGKQKYEIGSLTHREYILFNNLEKAGASGKYNLGDTYTAKGRKGTGQLVAIMEDLREVEWEGLKVKFLEVWFSHEDFIGLYHPSDLKGV